MENSKSVSVVDTAESLVLLLLLLLLLLLMLVTVMTRLKVRWRMDV